MKPLPLHERIRAGIEARILSGAWPPGHRVPGETELMAQHQCARMTVNKALSALAAAGLVERRRRAGTFVAHPRTRSMVLDVPDLATEIAARGDRYAWRLLLHQLGKASGDEPDWVARGGQVLTLEGVHLVNGHPLAFERRQISLAAVSEAQAADFAVHAPGSWLLAHIPWTEVETRISAALASGEISRALGAQGPQACLLVARRTWRAAVPVTRVEQWFVAGEYELVARFGPK
jgi:GntR family histidine utilization transcriptional repressor